jgi:DNA-binding CsgD family transcriptional regulator
MADDLVATRPRPTPDDPLPQLVKLRGDALAQLGRTSEAEAAYLAARDGARLLGYRPLLWRIDQALGTLWATLGRGAEADESFMRARATIEDVTSTLDDPELREEFRARAQGRLPRSMPAGSGSGAPVVDRLSPRERDVLRYLVAGQSDREIAAALSISPRTVMHHVSRILDKLGASSRTAAATLAVREGLV